MITCEVIPSILAGPAGPAAGIVILPGLPQDLREPLRR
jgi:hypothetical protein